MIGTYRALPLTAGHPAVLLQSAYVQQVVRVVCFRNGGVEVCTNPGDLFPRFLVVAERDLVTHADYPHVPGYLVDCEACGSADHCSDGTCVHCQNEAAYAEAFTAEARTLDAVREDAYGDVSWSEDAEERFNAWTERVGQHDYDGPEDYQEAAEQRWQQEQATDLDALAAEDAAGVNGPAGTARRAPRGWDVV